ncbi:MAG: protein kinase [Candidatus Obscuribacterales bacterium]
MDENRQDKSSDICPVCSRPKASQSAGSITQWVASCVCLQPADLAEDQVIDLDICTVCGKRIGAGRKGSFTQFIFRSQLCACAVPSPALSPVLSPALSPESPAPAESRSADSDTPEDEEYLDLSAEDFPVDRYRPLSRLGKGGEGSVILCRDLLLKKLVAVKTLNHMEDQDQLLAFHEEARVVSHLLHPDIIRILDFGVTGSGVPYMVLEHFPSVTLADLIEAEGPRPFEEACRIFERLAAALAHSHAQGMYHRDVKPSNILVSHPGSEEEEVRLIDFSFPARVRQGDTTEIRGRSLTGTPAYMAPELVDGADYDSRCDVYSFGCSLFETLTGRTPFVGENAFDVIMKHVKEEPPYDLLEEAEIPDRLLAVISGCLARDPERRFQDGSAVREALSTAMGALPSPPAEESKLPSGGPRPSLVLILACLVLPLATAAFYFLRANPQTRKTPSSPLSRKVRGAGRESKKSFNLLPFYVNQRGVGAYRAGGSIDHDAFEKLSKIRDLAMLDFYFDSIIDWSSLPLLRTAPLKTLSLVDTNIRDRDLIYVAQLDNISELALDSTEISSDGLVYIKDMKLKLLSLQETAVSGAGLEIISDMKRLDTLDLQNMVNLKEGDLAVLSRMTGLSILDLSCNDIGPEALRIAAHLPITRLCLNQSGITDDELSELAASSTLTGIELDENRSLTDAGIARLRSIKSLTYVRTLNCPLIKKDYILIAGRKVPVLRAAGGPGGIYADKPVKGAAFDLAAEMAAENKDREKKRTGP